MLQADYCHRLDQTGMYSYLETDKPENVRLDERFGYELAAESDVIGITSWFILTCATFGGPG